MFTFNQISNSKKEPTLHFESLACETSTFKRIQKESNSRARKRVKYVTPMASAYSYAVLPPPDQLASAHAVILRGLTISAYNEGFLEF